MAKLDFSENQHVEHQGHTWGDFDAWIRYQWEWNPTQDAIWAFLWIFEIFGGLIKYGYWSYSRQTLFEKICYYAHKPKKTQVFPAILEIEK